jgi:hypothetical protein
MKLNEIALDIRNIISERQKELNLTFEEENHIYMMNGRNDYPSVSKVLKYFYTEFPIEEASYKKAKGDLIEQQRLIESWAAAGEYSAHLGSRVHYELEKELIERNGNYKEVRKPIFECDLTQLIKSDNMIRAGRKYLDLMEERGVVLLDTEMVLGDPDLGYVGQPDKVWLTKNKSGNDFGILITDYKTNKPKSFQVTKYTNKLKKPFESFHDTALGHYFLQLPLYGKLLLKMLEGSKYENIKLYGCIVLHLLEEGAFNEYRVPKEIIDTILEMDMKNYLI